MRYLTISYTVVYPNPDAKPMHYDHVLLATPDGETFYHPEGGPSYFYLNKDAYKIHKDHGEFKRNGDDWDEIDRLVLENKSRYHRPKAEIKESAGWLSPDGQFYPCLERGHISLAETICRSMLGVLKEEEELRKRKWAKVWGSGDADRMYSLLTDAQVATMLKIAEIAEHDEYRKNMMSNLS